jgi:hypothetical protein
MMPNSSRSLILRFEVDHVGAVQPFGFLPAKLVRTLMDSARTSRSCEALRVGRSSWM